MRHFHFSVVLFKGSLGLVKEPFCWRFNQENDDGDVVGTSFSGNISHPHSAPLSATLEEGRGQCKRFSAKKVTKFIQMDS